MHVNILTNEKDLSNVYSDNTVHNVDISLAVSDNSIIDASLTKAKNGCIPCGKKIRRGGRNKKHI